MRFTSSVPRGSIKPSPRSRFLAESIFFAIKMHTRKLSYRKDDRAMRPIYGCPENFGESLRTPTATFPERFSEHLLRSIL